MTKIMRVLFGVVCVGVITPAFAAPRPLTGVYSANVTSDTAAVAKNKAMDAARREIIVQTLSSYSMADALNAAVADAKSADLTPLILGTNIDGEQSSDTTYTANITMTIDRDAAKKWLDANNVQNWLTDGLTSDKFTMNIAVVDKLADWGAINKIARDENVEITPVSIMGTSIVATMPAANRTGFTIALRDAGWRTADSDGTLMIAK